MGLVLYGGYYEKQKALHILRNLKYYNSQFELIQSAEEMARGRGIFGLIAIQEEKMHEDFLIDKMNVVKSILDKQGDAAIDAFQELTSPNENYLLSPIKKFFPEDKGIIDMLDELSIPMPKEEFYHYLDIYNQFYSPQQIIA